LDLLSATTADAQEMKNPGKLICLAAAAVR
jgi:hypothetical protein